jgi:preprotein translocase subunit SecA
MLLMQRKYNEAEEFIKRMEQAEMPTDEMKTRRDNKVASMRKQIQTDMEAIKERMRQGRNEPCKCGSGKKFKHCHGV